MNNNIEMLVKEFKRIKNMGLIKPLRNGTSGIGYTFETLLGKKEDQECKPDYKGIEIKCKIGYTKMPLVLFHFESKRDDDIVANNYIFNNYSYHKYNNPENERIFALKIFANYAINKNNYTFKLKIDYEQAKLIMQSFYNDTYLEDVCYWDFQTLREKLITKLSYLAIVDTYPYYRNGERYYRYLKMKIYKLKSFEMFLKLIAEDKIFVFIVLKENYNEDDALQLRNHGTSFGIRRENIPLLFDVIK